MSVKDGDPWLTSCVKSILSQTVSNFEFLIVDDASTDRTSEILSAFEEKDKRIRGFEPKLLILTVHSEKMEEIFGNVETLEKKGGFRVYLSKKLHNHKK